MCDRTQATPENGGPDLGSRKSRHRLRGSPALSWPVKFLRWRQSFPVKCQDSTTRRLDDVFLCFLPSGVWSGVNINLPQALSASAFFFLCRGLPQSLRFTSPEIWMVEIYLVASYTGRGPISVVLSGLLIFLGKGGPFKIRCQPKCTFRMEHPRFGRKGHGNSGNWGGIR